MIEKILQHIPEDDWKLPLSLLEKYTQSAKEFTFMIIRPDAIYRNQLGQIIKFLENHEIYVLSQVQINPSSRLIEELYRYTQVKIMNQKERPLWWLTPKYYNFGPAVALILRGPKLHNTSLAERLALLKGSSNPMLTQPGQIRYEFDALNTVMCVIHTSATTIEALREACLFFTAEHVESALNNIRNSPLPSPVISEQNQSDSNHAEFFEIVTHLQDEVANSLGIHFKVVKDSFEKHSRIDSNESKYLQSYDIYSNLWKARLKQINELGIQKNDLAEILFALLNPSQLFSINVEQLLAYLHQFDIFISEWQSLLLETGCAFFPTKIYSAKYLEKEK